MHLIESFQFFFTLFIYLVYFFFCFAGDLVFVAPQHPRYFQQFSKFLFIQFYALLFRLLTSTHAHTYTDIPTQMYIQLFSRVRLSNKTVHSSASKLIACACSAAAHWLLLGWLVSLVVRKRSWLMVFRLRLLLVKPLLWLWADCFLFFFKFFWIVHSFFSHVLRFTQFAH